MANYATNLFFCSTENENDLEKVEKFLDEKFFDCYLERSEDYVDGEFYSKWDFPEALINEMIERVCNSDSDEDALAIIDEYIEPCDMETYNEHYKNIQQM